jgi:hypothetical protein
MMQVLKRPANSWRERSDFLKLLAFRSILFHFVAPAMMPNALRLFPVIIILSLITSCLAAENPCGSLKPFVNPPAAFENNFGAYKSLMSDANGGFLTSPGQWQQRRREIFYYWDKMLGSWPPLISRPKVEILQTTAQDSFTEQRVRVEIAKDQTTDGYLLIPNGKGPFPAVFVPYYEPETSLGRSKQTLRDFGLQLARRGFVTLSIGSPGGDARKPPQTQSQPLYFLAYVAANCANALGNLPQVDKKRIGVVGHSYGGKWAMFAACFYGKFACGVWSDPGIVFDEARSNVNYWEPWYLGFDSGTTRKPGVITPENPRTGPYKKLIEEDHDLTEVLALMAPRPFLVSGGSEDTAERWIALNRVREVYQLFGRTNAIALTTRPKHDPTPESNEVIYRFFECFLKPGMLGQEEF